MTLEEWEARQKGGGGSAGGSGGAGLAALQRQQHGQQGQPLSDEELARQLQRQLDLEAAAEWGTPLNGAPAVGCRDLIPDGCAGVGMEGVGSELGMVSCPLI
jgi:hypothetical protein